VNNKEDLHRYDDIIHLSHPVSKSHPPMPRMNRAAQFAPFAALTGYDAKVQEAARITDRRKELDEDSNELLDEKIRQLQERITEQPVVEVIYFEKDGKKEGGRYLTKRERIKKIDVYQRQLIFQDDVKIPLMNIIDLEEEK